MKPWQTVLDFWFGDQEPPEAAYQKRWFTGGEELDRIICERFKTQHQRAVEGELQAWLSHPQGRLAKIILVDQFSRNIYRGEAAAFAWDSLACQWSEDALKNGHLDALSASGRMFCLMPLMHSEHEDHHHLLDREAQQLLKRFPDQEAFLESFVQAAQQHREIIVRFGRYPHRNAVLGRESTAEEADYLAGDAARFGQ
ncbi:MAG: DUF924 domain-containing protein [Saccharospirillum sp.]|nr:DUF924 domain-containing protein [Saccharospirillum sp.]